jgi:hypothetical protein
VISIEVPAEKRRKHRSTTPPFFKDFNITWAPDHTQLLDNGEVLELKLDNTSGTFVFEWTDFLNVWWECERVVMIWKIKKYNLARVTKGMWSLVCVLEYECLGYLFWTAQNEYLFWLMNAGLYYWFGSQMLKKNQSGKPELWRKCHTFSLR